ncbi:MAG: metallophosphoesterase family protein [Thermoplasmata archaeon]|nr:metallophosphoesterase family protein [Thermoplasmata archaeon]
MRILVFSDVHSSERAVGLVSKDIEEYLPDLLIVCGDLTHFGPGAFAEKFLNSASLMTLAIPGNCDPPDVLALLQERGVDLHGKKVEIGGFDFVGFGGSNITPFETLTEFTEDEIFDSLDKIMVERAVLVTHAPPKGYLDGPNDEKHFGSTAVARIVEKYHPIVALFGHIHEARGIVREKDTVFVNPGPAMRGHRALLELTEDGAEVELLG